MAASSLALSTSTSCDEHLNTRMQHVIRLWWNVQVQFSNFVEGPHILAFFIAMQGLVKSLCQFCSPVKIGVLSKQGSNSCNGQLREE